MSAFPSQGPLLGYWQHLQPVVFIMARCACFIQLCLQSRKLLQVHLNSERANHKPVINRQYEEQKTNLLSLTCWLYSLTIDSEPQLLPLMIAQLAGKCMLAAADLHHDSISARILLVWENIRNNKFRLWLHVNMNCFPIQHG